MTPIPPIPEERLASRLWREWNEYKAAAHSTGIGGMDYSKWLIERIAKLTEEVERLKEQHAYYVSIQEPQHRQALEERDEARAENTRLKAPVSDEETNRFCELMETQPPPMKSAWQHAFNAILASRATRTPPQEGQ